MALLAAVAPTHAESAVAECDDKLPCGDRSSACGDEPIDHLFWHVVVVEIEAARGDPLGAGELVQLSEVVIAHQMRPESPMSRPTRGIDQDRHTLIIESLPRETATRLRQLLRDAAESGNLDPWCVSCRFRPPGGPDKARDSMVRKTVVQHRDLP